MCCTTLITQVATMATTQVLRAVGYEVYWPLLEEPEATTHTAMRMNWVVVTDDSGTRRLRMCWRAGRDD